MNERRYHRLRGAIFLLIVAALCAFAARDFLAARKDEPLFPAGCAKVKHLSDYFAPLKGTRADSKVFIFEGSEPGGTLLVLGGTHPNEPAGFLAAYVLVENAAVPRGRLIVVPRANHSGFTHTEPGEAMPLHFEIATPSGNRVFRVGCRFTNPLDQWPDPEVYLHYPSGQRLSGNETRNLNRAYPGRADGDFTERAAFAITSLVNREQVDLVIDLHESSPEYPVINAIVAHERAMDLAATANLTLQGEGLNFALEPSPTNFHGLSHRELGDATSVLAVLLESANVMQGRLRGATTAQKILDGKDDGYLRAARAGLLRVPYDSTGIPIETRVGRHLAAVSALTDALSSLYPDRSVDLRLPTYAELQAKGLGACLAVKTRSSE
jgi:predicted deacylase